MTQGINNIDRQSGRQAAHRDSDLNQGQSVLAWERRQMTAWRTPEIAESCAFLRWSGWFANE
jgi:hypothetical protein